MSVRPIVLLTGLLACGGPEETATTTDNLDSVFGFDTLSGRGRLDGDAPPITTRTINIPRGATTVLEARGCTAGTDPVLHLLRVGIEAATDDDSGTGVESRLTYTNNTPLPIDTRFTVVLRAKGNAVRGQCDLYRDGALLASQASAGGWLVRLPSLLANEEVETVNRPAGPAARIYLLESNDITMVRQYTGGTAGASLMSSSTALGTRFVVVGATSAGPLRVIRNDRLIADADGDEVGDQLEAALGTCSRDSDVRQNFECSRAADPQDTDGDGINDGWEIFGRRDRSPHQPLPQWGSDPRHKDVFVEVDYPLACGESGVDRIMTAGASRQMADLYADRTRTLSPLIELLRAQQLINPDLVKGINFHFDTGRAPVLPSDATIFGDWGGHNVVPTQLQNGACARAVVENVWQTQMSLARRGIFHYAFARPGAASNGHFLITSDWSDTNGRHGAHEFGHALGIGHSGPAFAQNGDPNCRTNYPSVMNYAYYDHWGDSSGVSFSDGTTGPVIFNRDLQEQNAVDPSDTDYLGWLQDVFKYNVDWTTGDVDWDRDGAIDTLTSVIAYSNFAPGGQGCEWTRYNKLDSIAGAKSDVTPAVGRLGGRTYVVYADQSTGAVKAVYTDDDLNCPEVDDDCGPFSGPITLPLDGTAGVTLAKIRRGSQDRLMIIATDSHLATASIELYRSGTSQAWTTPANVPITLTGSEPHAVSVDQFSFYLAHLGVFDRRLYWIRYNTFVGWSDETRAVQAPGVSLPSQPSSVHPALVWTYFPGAESGRRLYAILADSSSTLQFWRFDPATDLWTHAAAFPESEFQGKPTALWVRDGVGDRDGQLYVAYRDESNKPKFMRTYGDGLGAASQWTLGLDSNFDNSSARFNALTYFHEASVDTGLRLVDLKTDGTLRFRPNADGKTNLVFRDYSDWEVFAITLCRTLMRPEDAGIDSQIPDPVDCHPWTYPRF